MYSSVFILQAYVRPVFCLWPLLFLLSNLPAYPHSSFFLEFLLNVSSLWLCSVAHGECTHATLSLSWPSLFLEFHLERTPLLTSSHPPELTGQWCIKAIQQQRLVSNTWTSTSTPSVVGLLEWEKALVKVDTIDTRWTLVLWTWPFGCICSPDRLYGRSLC